MRAMWGKIKDMPGLSQLKEFSRDLLSLGNEVTLRAARGEKPVQVDIPSTIADVDDSDDFVLGIPEKNSAGNQETADNDLSGLAGIASVVAAKKSDSDDNASAFDAPDMSALLSPMGGDFDDDLPDFSMFEDDSDAAPENADGSGDAPPADQGLEALLDGDIFDDPAQNPADDLPDFPDPDTPGAPSEEGAQDNLPDIGSLSMDNFPEMEELPDLSDMPDDDFPKMEDFPDLAAISQADVLSEADEPDDALPQENPSETEILPEADDFSADSLPDIDSFGGAEPSDEESAETLPDLGDLDGLDNFSDTQDSSGEPQTPAEAEPVSEENAPQSVEETPGADDFSADSLPDIDGLSETDDFSADTLPDLDAVAEAADFSGEDTAASEEVSAEEGAPEPAEPSVTSLKSDDEPSEFDDILSNIEEVDIQTPPPSKSSDSAAASDEQSLDTFGIDEYGYDDFDYNAVHIPDEEEKAAMEAAGKDDDSADAPDSDDSDFELPEDGQESDENAESPDTDTPDSAEDSGEPTDIFADALPDIEDADFSTPDSESDDITDAADESADFDLPDIDEASLDSAESGLEDDAGQSDFDMPDFNADDLPEESDGGDDGIDLPDTDSADFDTPDFDTTGLDDPLPQDDAAQSDDSAGTDFEPDSEAGDNSLADLASIDLDDPAAASFDIDATEEIDDTGDEEASPDDFSADDAGGEIFDTSDMDNLDFDIPDTDEQLNAGSDFELGDGDDFAMEGEFEIPGFSDVDTAKEEKKSKPIIAGKPKRGKNKDLPEPDFSDAEAGDELPPNTLSDEQYKTFLKNLSEYPLNVRLAFEDLIVKDEFTEDAEFEIIEKILNKAPARQVASTLEKMLDISIPVPRDFEHRTAEEYEAYKKSLSYQLKNKIIPVALIGALSLLVLWGLFNFTKNCIYKPLKANGLYKQGYALLEADEYPQSEMKFNEAVSYRISKKWFFAYARGYRAHKQYQRAGDMYQNILRCFRHDKTAGLEYADMELNDMANYERAEEIVRREVLDYHINDKDGILMLGDIFLEWATDKDPSKFELAREQYATLIQLYGAQPLYQSRMMRYFVRTDNLREVLQLKPEFEASEKSLTSDDWTELSGYLLDKYYGPLDPSQEYLRYEIEGLRGILLKAVRADPSNPVAYYNLAKYFINTNEVEAVESTLQRAIENFNTVPSMKRRDVYKYIDSYRLLGEHYITTTDYLQAQEQFAEGISLFTTERDNAGFAGTPAIGKLYEDMGNIKYSVSGDYDEALLNYKYSVELENDTPGIRYRIGYIQYKNKNYLEALGAFMKAGDGNIKQRNLQFAMANTLFLRGDDYAAEGYYNQLIDSLDAEIAEEGILFPQTSANDYDIVNTYLYAANNYGVTLYRLAKRTGDSSLNAQSIVQFSQSVRAWDALTRNQETLVRLPGSNLAEQNIKYITNPIPEFEPSIYLDIPKTLLDNERL